MKNNDQKRSAIDQLHYSVKTTANCKYKAARRLKNFQNMSKTIIIVSSLGLIFIPLWNVTHIGNFYHSTFRYFLDFYQIFLAVIMLVFSSIISAVPYDLRIDKLEQCGFELRSFTKKIRRHIDSDNKIDENEFERLQNEYKEILKISLEQTDSDYVAVLSEEDPFKKIPNYYFRRYFTLHSIVVLWILIMMVLEMIVILHLVGCIPVSNLKVFC